MVTNKPSDLAYNMIRPLLIESSDHAARRKGVAQDAVDTVVGEIAAEQGIKEARRNNSLGDEFGSVNKSKIQPSTILEAYQKRQYAQKPPSDKPLTDDQRNRIYQNHLGQTTFANAA
jgi:hypothetical protein